MARKKIEDAIERREPGEAIARASEIEQWPLSRVKPYKKNAKRHPPEQIEMLARIVRKHGFDQPIVVDDKGVIVKGHGRWLAATELGMVNVPVIVRSDLDAASIAEARIADNRIAEYGWDFDVLIADVVGGMKHGLDPDMIVFTLKELGLENDGTSQDIVDHATIDSDGIDSESEDAGNGTGEVDIGRGAHDCPRCGFNFG